MTDVNPDLVEAIRSLDEIGLDELDMESLAGIEPTDPSSPTTTTPDTDSLTEPVSFAPVTDEPTSEGGVEGPPSETPTSSDDGGEVDDASSQPPVSASPPPNATELFADLYRDTYGVDPTPEAVVEMVGLAQSVRALTPEQRVAIQQVIAGQQLGQPVAPVQPITPQAPVPPQPVQPLPYPQPVTPIPEQPAVFTPVTFLEETYVEPEVRAAFEAQQQQIALLAQQSQQALAQSQQLQQAQHSAQLEAERAQAARAIEEAEATWRDSYPELSERDMHRITFKASESGAAIFPTLLAQHGGDHAAATHALLNVTLAGLPDINERITQTRVQAAADRALADATRKQKASALSGGSSATPRTRATSQKDRDREAIREIAALEFGTEL